MIRLPSLRIIVDPHANSGDWNMAVDEALLQSAIDRNVAALRWYRWREPTVSLGYFQQVDDVVADTRLANLPRVRRLSGGGALVHDQELTYSLTLPATQRLVASPVELYGLVHRAFIDVLGNRGVRIESRGMTNRRRNEPPLCFQREDEHDLVLHRHKVLGSAQRRRRGAILQHGGLLLAASRVAPDLPGICDLTTGADLTGLENAVSGFLSAWLTESAFPDVLSDMEIEFTHRLLAN